ncbi:MAG: aminopeptidase P N-terminal domain-containing protein [Bacteroidia bacterium]|nr:aminopeptidase P N-terminal domain-containing protein [Bacteroidia bacterium]MBP7437966.1 aminopeptidase P N-terminal domain-containing protein [Bacteroidia bacterium]
MICWPVANALAQDEDRYRNEQDFLPADFYRARRAALRELLPDGSCAVLFSAPVRNRSNDVDFPYHQNPDFYYLSGWTEPNSVLVIFKEAQQFNKGALQDILLVPPRDAPKERWTGRRGGKTAARRISGADWVLTTESWDSLQLPLPQQRKVLQLRQEEPRTAGNQDPLELDGLLRSYRTKLDKASISADDFLLKRALTSLRMVKQPEELNLLKRAIAISVDGHLQMMSALEPSMTEYQVEAVGEYVFHDAGAEAVGYPSICGGGENSTILHYTDNRRQLRAGELILLDMGAEYHGYTADITRTLPVSGKYTPEQRIIYNLVLEARDSGIAACRPGQPFQAPNAAARRVISRGLQELGIIESADEVKTYFMHGTSHYLGLDVHDMGNYGPLAPGNVITVEPGIYISADSPCDRKWWGIGIRIEDDILITTTGHKNLSEKLPVKPEEVEKAMEQPSILNNSGLKNE